MSEGDVARARAALAAFGTGDLDRLVRQFHPDFVGVVPPELSAEPDTYRGHAGTPLPGTRPSTRRLPPESACCVGRMTRRDWPEAPLDTIHVWRHFARRR